MSLVSLPFSKPFDVQSTFQQALTYHHQGRIAEAEPLYAAVLNVRPDHFDALQMLGVIKLARGEPATALRLITAAMQQRPKSPQVLVNYGTALEANGRYQEALEIFDRAIRHKSKFAEAHNNRGSVLVTLDRCEEALEGFRKALAIKPDYAEAIYNQGSALRKLDRFEEAIRCFDRALALRPNYAEAYCNRGAALEGLGRWEEALACSDRAVLIKPDFPEAQLNRCAALRSLGRYDEAMQGLDRLVATRPNYAEAYHHRGLMLSDANRAVEAIGSYEKAVSFKPAYSKARWASCMGALPILYAEESEIDVRRADYERRLRALSAQYEAGGIPGDMSKGLGMAQPFLLPYQARNDRDLQRLFGTLATRIMSTRYPAARLAAAPQPGEPIRVGIVSGFFWQHSVWKVGIKGWVTQLDPRRFQVFGYNTNHKQDGETAIARERCHKFVQGPMSTEDWRRTILADAPHIILYPEIGMNPETAELAALRLAPVQCSYFGHPQTSGYPTIDYFLSGELFEPADGEEHYSERLVRLPNIAFHYEPLQLKPVTVTRAELGLRPDAVAYWCAQSLFKYLPQYDAVFPRIAQQVRGCQFVFIRHPVKEVTALFEQRLDRAFAAADLKAADHCVFLPAMDLDRFGAATAQCDAMLDSIDWSGGNTTLEALAQGLPVVTHRGGLMRGRVSAGILEMMGMSETIAETVDAFEALAVRVGVDTGWRAELKTRVTRERERVYRDRTCIAALEAFIDRVARQSR